MSDFPIVLAVLAAASGLVAFFVLKYHSLYQSPALPRETPVERPPEVTPTATSTPATIPESAPSPALDWSSPKGAWHAARVTMDDMGLTGVVDPTTGVKAKDLLCACIYQESRFNNSAINRNRAPGGALLSSDWGLCQINDFYHIGPGKDFPSTAYVVIHPEKAVAFMIRMYNAGLLKQWVSFSSGAYRQWLVPTSPMWTLAIDHPGE
jgi:hypothetical protein